MKVLLTGAAGQLGQSLLAARPEGIDLIATSRAELDLSDPEACIAAVHHHRPDWLLNAGAYTAVDQAEKQPQLAMAVNAAAPRAFAEALLDSGGRLLQLSTDFVFNGQQGRPYATDQLRDPLGVYGASKAAGEEAVEDILAGSGRATILRTSWLMGPLGKNFALTILRLHRERDKLGVVGDQVGCPTSTLTLAAACWRLIEKGSAESAAVLPEVLHWSDAGAASWYDVAVAVGQLGQELGLIEQPAEVKSITTADYPTPAERPSYSLLDCVACRKALELEGQHWRSALQDVLQQVSASA